MTAIDPCVGIRFAQPPGVAEELVEPSASGASGDISVVCTADRASISTSVFEVEYSDFGIACTTDDGPIAGMRHELDREDIGMMAGADASVECKRLCQIYWVVVPYVQISVI